MIEEKQRPENIFNQVDSIAIIAIEKEPLQTQLINELIIYGLERPENILQRTGEFEIEKTPRPENILEQRDSIEILGYEKDPLTTQLINELIIYGLEKPENLV